MVKNIVSRCVRPGKGGEGGGPKLCLFSAIDHEKTFDIVRERRKKIFSMNTFPMIFYLRDDLFRFQIHFDERRSYNVCGSSVKLYMGIPATYIPLGVVTAPKFFPGASFKDHSR